MAKKELNAKKIVMDIILVLVLITGIILLIGVFGNNNSKLEDVNTKVENNSNKVTNLGEILATDIDEVANQLEDFQTNVNKKDKNTNNKIKDINTLISEKTVEVINMVDTAKEEIITNDNNNALILNENLVNVQTNLFGSLVNVESNLANYVSTKVGVINDNIESAKEEMHLVGRNVLQGISDSNELWATYMNSQFGTVSTTLNTLENNLKAEINNVGGTVLGGLAGHIDTHHEYTNSLILAMNTKVDALATKSDLTTAVSTLVTTNDLANALNGVATKTDVETSVSSAVSEIKGSLSDEIDAINQRFDIVEDLFNNSSTGLFVKLGNVSERVENVYNLLETMDNKLDTLLENTAKKSNLEITAIIAECSVSGGFITTATEAATCVTEKLGY